MSRAHNGPANHRRRLGRIAITALLTLALGACNALTRLSQVGQEPPLAAVQNPAILHGNEPVAMPMPPPVDMERQPNSLWRPGSRHFLKDQRASEVGDILTVVIDIEDEASINNATTRSRNNFEEAALTNFLGFEAELDSFLPPAVDPTSTRLPR